MVFRPLGHWVTHLCGFILCVALAGVNLYKVRQMLPDKPDPSVEFFTKGIPKLYATLKED